MNRRARRWPLLGAAALATACSSAGGAVSGASTPSTPSMPARSAIAALIVDTGRDVQRARAELVAGCMQEQGFDYVIDVAADAPAGGGDREYVERYGYGILSPPPEPAPPPDPNRAREQRLRPEEAAAYFTALLGAPTPDATATPGSCLGRGDALVSELATQFGRPAVNEFLAEYDAAVLADPRSVAAEEEWVRCMRGQGYEVADRDEIVRGLLAEADRGLAGEALTAAQARERAVARADFGCSQPVEAVRRTVEQELAPRFAARLEPLLVP